MELKTVFTQQLAIINEAIKRVPAVAYALAAVGFAAAGSIIVKFLGHDRAAIIVISGTFIAAILVYAFSTLISSTNKATTFPGTVLLYAVTAFFVVFLTFTITAFVSLWPEPWARILGIMPNPDPNHTTQMFGPTLIKPGEKQSLSVETPRSGSVEVIIISITPEFTDAEKADRLKSGIVFTPELAIKLCQAAMTTCPEWNQRGMGEAIVFSAISGITTVEFFNFSTNPKLAFSAKIIYKSYEEK